MTDRLKVALVLLAAVAVGLGLARVARGQQIEPDVWAPSSGYSVGPGGAISSWNAEGGYALAPDGTTSSWSGPVFQPAPVWSTPPPVPAWTYPQSAPVLVPDGWPQP